MSDFYTFFDHATNNGRILEVDVSEYQGTLPSQSLTVDEFHARQRWNRMIQRGGGDDENVRRHYKGKNRVVDSSTTLLIERVCPPQFVEQHPSTRYGSEGRNPMSPAQIQVWSGFKNLVSNFNPGETQHHVLDGDIDDDVFMRSLNSGTVVRDEKDEFVYIKEHVLRRLRDAQLINYRDDQRIPRQGLPDFLLGKQDNDHKWEPTLATEFKASHSLPLPMSAEKVVECHNIGKSSRANSMKGAFQKRVCYPVGQLLRYMSCNGLRVGALSSANRTYFFLIEDSSEKVGDIVKVSEAFFVGEQNYLRAWAYCYDLGCRLDRYDPAEVEWAESDEEFVDSTSDDESNQDTSGASNEKRNEDATSPNSGGDKDASHRDTKRQRLSRNRSASALRSSLTPWIPFSSVAIDLKHPLGYGRNGCVFRGVWENRAVAVKQFDLAVPGVSEKAQKEISAYEKLKHCQGILVPKAHFLSKSKYGILYFGLQLGRMPEPEDDVSHWGEIVAELRREYSFQHDDADGRNGLFIPDKHDGERLVAIDLEEHTFLQCPTRTPPTHMHC